MTKTSRSGVGHLYSDAAGNFVAHAGEAVLHVIALRIACPPKFVKIARQTTGRAYHDVFRTADLVDDADYFALADGRADSYSVDPVDFNLPFLAVLLDSSGVLRINSKIS